MPRPSSPFLSLAGVHYPMATTVRACRASLASRFARASARRRRQAASRRARRRTASCDLTGDMREEVAEIRARIEKRTVNTTERRAGGREPLGRLRRTLRGPTIGRRRDKARGQEHPGAPPGEDGQDASADPTISTLYDVSAHLGGHTEAARLAAGRAGLNPLAGAASTSAPRATWSSLPVKTDAGADFVSRALAPSAELGSRVFVGFGRESATDANFHVNAPFFATMDRDSMRTSRATRSRSARDLLWATGAIASHAYMQDLQRMVALGADPTRPRDFNPRPAPRPGPATGPDQAPDAATLQCPGGGARARRGALRGRALQRRTTRSETPCAAACSAPGARPGCRASAASASRPSALRGVLDADDRRPCARCSQTAPRPRRRRRWRGFPRPSATTSSSTSGTCRLNSGRSRRCSASIRCPRCRRRRARGADLPADERGARRFTTGSARRAAAASRASSGSRCPPWRRSSAWSRCAPRAPLSPGPGDPSSSPTRLAPTGRRRGSRAAAARTSSPPPSASARCRAPRTTRTRTSATCPPGRCRGSACRPPSRPP